MPTTVVLSMCIGVGGCGWPSSCNVIRITCASFAFRNRDPSSASAAEAATNLRMLQREWIGPLRLIGFPLIGSDPRKKCPPALLHALGAVRYDASLWQLRIMSEA